MSQLSFAEIFDKWPSIAALATDVGQPYPTVAAWKRRGSIPPEAWPHVVRAAAKRDIEGVTVETLANMRQPRRRAAE